MVLIFFSSGKIFWCKRWKFKGHTFLQFHHVFVPFSSLVSLIFPWKFKLLSALFTHQYSKCSWTLVMRVLYSNLNSANINWLQYCSDTLHGLQLISFPACSFKLLLTYSDTAPISLLWCSCPAITSALGLLTGFPLLKTNSFPSDPILRLQIVALLCPGPSHEISRLNIFRNGGKWASLGVGLDK